MIQDKTRIGVLGAGGRMGQAIIAMLAGHPTLVLAGAIERAGHAAVGRSPGLEFPPGLTICSNPFPLAHACDVLIDFTTPSALAATLDAACEGNAAIVIGTTGLEAEHHALIDAAARSIAVLQAANTSLGVTLLARLVGDAARALGPDWDIEIAELPSHAASSVAASADGVVKSISTSQAWASGNGLEQMVKPGGNSSPGDRPTAA